MRKRVGDTLVEVALAIGIFSMVAIAIVTIMSGGTSNAQTSLETTLAREEIDSQAEALRFIHSAYLADADSGNEDYVNLWETIVSRAITPDTNGHNEYANYNPATCQAVFDSDLLADNGFVINVRALGSDTANAYVAFSDKFKTASTHPRLIYSAEQATGEDSLISSPTNTDLYRVEGIYVIAVRDPDTTQIVGDSSPTSQSGYYDFYIRTCWYGIGSDTPSIISTVIRLYNPPGATDRHTTPSIKINFFPNGGSGSMSPINVRAGESITVPEPTFVDPGLNFLGWNTKKDGTGYGRMKDNSINPAPSGVTYQPGTTYTVPTGLSSYQVLNLYAIWDRFQIVYNGNHGSSVPTTYCEADDDCYISEEVPTRSGFTFKGWTPSLTQLSAAFQPGQKITPTQATTTLYALWERYEINYDANGGSYAPEATYCPTSSCALSSEVPSRSGYRFQGWSTSASATSASYDPGSAITLTNLSTTLYAVWESHNETITITLRWGGSPSDLDSHIEGQKSDGSSFHAYYGQRAMSDIDGTTIASLNQDVTSGYGPEIFTLNTLGGKNYYYYVHNFSGSGRFSGATVTVTGPSIGTLTFTSNSAQGSGRYWNVFAYKDGVIVTKNNFTSSAQINY